MKKTCTDLNIQHASGMTVSNNGVYFYLGPQTFLGNFFIFITFVSYIASVFFMGEVFDDILVGINNNYKYIGYFVSVIFGVMLVCGLVAWGRSFFYFLLTVILFLSMGWYLLYMSTEGSLLIYSLPLIVAGHIGNYIFEVVKGDDLTIKLSSNTYEINYRHTVVSEGVFYQNDIEIRVSDAAEAGDSYGAVFLPATKSPMGYTFNKCHILHAQGFDKNILLEMESDLEKLFSHLGVSYENNSWIVKRKKGSG